MKLSEMINKVICGDCLEVMKGIPDKSIDLVLTDPPYGINVTGVAWQGYVDPEGDIKRIAKGLKVRGQGLAMPKKYPKTGDWDKQKVGKEYFDEIRRISKNQVIFGGNYYGQILGDTSCYLVWDKDNGGNNFADCELAWTSFKTAVRKFKWRWNGMLQEVMGDKEFRQHPTQKPVPLFEWVIKNYSDENALILDPFLGSGTTARACVNLKRNFIGIEISPEYCKIAEDRLKQGVLNF